MKKIMTRLLSLVLLGAFIPSFVLADNWDLDKGSITVSATAESQTVSQAGGSPTVDHNPVITSSSGKTNNTVTITAEKNATANVTLENVNIDTGTRGGAAITTSGEGNVNIELDGTNRVQSGNDHAGVEKKGDGTLTITDENKDGSLTATGGRYGAGIGGGEYGSVSNIAIEGGKVTAQGDTGGAGIGGGRGGNGSNIAIEGGKVEAIGSGGGAGIGGGVDVGGGQGGSGSNITISGGEVTAQGGVGGAGIGGGISGTGSDVTISGDAQVKVQGGTTGEDWHKGAAIGNGGTPTTEGNEVSPNTSDLTVEGSIQIYEPGKNINTDTPDKTIEGQKGDHSWNAGEVTTPATCTAPGVRTYTCTKNPAHTKTEPIPALNHLFSNYTYDNNATCTQDGTETAKCERCDATDTRTVKGSKLTGNTAETVPESKAAAYWVSDPEGQSIPYQAQQQDGVLTVTVQADTASLCGTTGSLGQLEAQGVAEIRFVTNRAQSDFTLSDLLTSGTGSFTLTHDGDKVTFTLENADISGILK